MDVSEVLHTKMSPIEQAASLKQPSIESSSKDCVLTGQPIWEVELSMGRQQGSTAAAFPSIPSEEEVKDLAKGRDAGEEEIRAVTATASLTDKVEKTDMDSVVSKSLSTSIRLGAPSELSVPAPIQEQRKMFYPHTLQTVVTSCEIPEPRTTLEGSQVELGFLQRCWHTRGVLFLFSKLTVFSSCLLPPPVNYHYRPQL